MVLQYTNTHQSQPLQRALPRRALRVPLVRPVAFAVLAILLIFYFVDFTPSSILDRAILRRLLSDDDALAPYSHSLADVFEFPVRLGPNPGQDIPYFWHIHKAGGSTMKDILGVCLQKVQTARVEEEGCSDKEDEIKVCEHVDAWSILNVDASSFDGIERAIEKGLCCDNHFPEIPRDDSFIVVSSRVYDALPIFQPSRRGRLFALFRDPIERVVSKYYYTKLATWEKNYKPQVANMTLLEYANSKMCYNDWMTRRLVDKMHGDLTRDDLMLAMDIMRRKVLVLLTDDMAGSVERMRQYFGWDSTLTVEQLECVNKNSVEQPLNANPHPAIEPESQEWELIREKNLMDLELVEFARQLYKEQGEMISSYKEESRTGLNKAEVEGLRDPKFSSVPSLYPEVKLLRNSRTL